MFLKCFTIFNLIFYILDLVIKTYKGAGENWNHVFKLDSTTEFLIMFFNNNSIKKGLRGLYKGNTYITL